MDMRSLPNFCFVIITRNEDEHIIACVESILRQEYESNKVRIVVVDTGSTDRTVEIITSYKKQFKLKMLEPLVLMHTKHNAGFLRSHARNFAVNHCAKSCFIVFLDAHVILPSSTWLKTLAHHVKERTVISGPVITPPELSPLLRYFTPLELKEVMLTLLRCDVKKEKVFYGGNFSIHRSLFMEAGQFPAVKRSEDLALLENAQNIGGQLISLDATYVYHLDSRLLSYGEWLKRMFFEGFYSGNIRLTNVFSLRAFFMICLVSILALGIVIPQALFILPCTIVSAYFSAMGWWTIKLTRLVSRYKAKKLTLRPKLLFALLFIGSLQAFIVNVGKVFNVVRSAVEL